MEKGPLTQKYLRIQELLRVYGQDVILGMVILVIGMILLQWFIRRFHTYLSKHKGDKWPVRMITAIVYLFLLLVVLNFSFVFMGFHGETIANILSIITLLIIAIMIIFRPYFPNLPFHVGNIVLIAGLFGKVESANMYHTKLKTFDGKLVFIPNSKIMADVVVNYHATPGRRIGINVRISYEEDLIRAKQLLEAVMIRDLRVLKTPRPQVWTLNLDGGSVELGARCWADNDKYWLTKCELTEIIKLRFDREGIELALPRGQVFLRHQDRIGEGFTQEQKPEGAKGADQ